MIFFFSLWIEYIVINFYHYPQQIEVGRVRSQKWYHTRWVGVEGGGFILNLTDVMTMIALFAFPPIFT